MNPLASIKGTIALGVLLTVLTILAFSHTQNMLTITAWLHVSAGITWIGLLYYFNFVQVPAVAQAAADSDGPGPAAISKYVAPSALLWFRMAAATTVVLGLILLEVVAGGIIHALTFSSGVEIIGLGSWLGIIMAFNVWFIIWPNQKKILGMVSATDAEVGKAKIMAATASRINVVLSLPMLLCMLAYRL